MPILGEPREIYDVYVSRCAHCEIFPLPSLINKGSLARFDDPMRAEEILEAILAGEDVSHQDIAWLATNWSGAGEAAHEWYRLSKKNDSAATPERGNEK